MSLYDTKWRNIMHSCSDHWKHVDPHDVNIKWSNSADRWKTKIWKNQNNNNFREPILVLEYLYWLYVHEYSRTVKCCNVKVELVSVIIQQTHLLSLLLFTLLRSHINFISLVELNTAFFCASRPRPPSPQMCRSTCSIHHVHRVWEEKKTLLIFIWPTMTE